MVFWIDVRLTRSVPDLDKLLNPPQMIAKELVKIGPTFGFQPLFSHSRGISGDIGDSHHNPQTPRANFDVGTFLRSLGIVVTVREIHKLDHRCWRIIYPAGECGSPGAVRRKLT
jgi:hypothetical protein